jgi:hypothetical protein
MHLRKVEIRGASLDGLRVEVTGLIAIRKPRSESFAVEVLKSFMGKNPFKGSVLFAFGAREVHPSQPGSFVV